MWEEKYIPDMSQMTIDEKAGVATALKKLAERRFKPFEKEKDEIIEKTYYDEEYKAISTKRPCLMHPHAYSNILACITTCDTPLVHCAS